MMRAPRVHRPCPDIAGRGRGALGGWRGAWRAGRAAGRRARAAGDRRLPERGAAGRDGGGRAELTSRRAYHLAGARRRGDAGLVGEWGSRTPEQARGERDRLGPLLPDLERRLPADSPVLLDVRRRLAHAAWLLGDYATAAPLYLRLYPDPEALAERGHAEVAYRVARSIGEAGDPARALALLKTLLHRLHLTAGNTHWLTREVTDIRADFRRMLWEDRRFDLGGGLSRLFGR
ncbi:hypothetical protein [Streptomyces sp. NPDC051577]|uniref:tetratricopeptide repeat protein n=1 Tax=Streptomyces sp. NPDC051577 TaxID=3155166 RepID=UPI00343C3CC4